MSTLELCLQVAAKAHSGQVYFGNPNSEPYILHPIRVMLRMKTPEEQQLAILHDILEDTPWTLDQIRDVTRVSQSVLISLQFITRDKDRETYSQYIERLSENELARAVKIQDLKENLSRNPCPKLKQRYLDALNRLEEPEKGGQ